MGSPMALSNLTLSDLESSKVKVTQILSGSRCEWYTCACGLLLTYLGPNGSEHFKILLLLQITANSFQTRPEFPPNVPRQITLGIF